MNEMDMICIWIAEIVPLIATLFSFVYGLKHFFKKGKPIFMQTITLAMASHSLGSIYHLCQTLTSEDVMEGFTPAYLGRIGFFLFLLTANYAQLDKIVDDGSTQMRPARLLALIAPISAVILYIYNTGATETPVSTKVVYALVWIPALISVYFTCKHTLIPDLDFGFIKALRPFHVMALLLSFSELACLTAWNYYYMIPLAITSIVFAIVCVITIIMAKRGVDKWRI